MSQLTVHKTAEEEYTQIKKLNFTNKIKTTEVWEYGLKSLYTLLPYLLNHCNNHGYYICGQEKRMKLVRFWGVLCTVGSRKLKRKNHTSYIGMQVQRCVGTEGHIAHL